MHYDRGQNLSLLIESIERNVAGAHIAIFDDGSTEPDTVALLQTLANRCPIFINREKNSQVYLRGLHANMNAALDYAVNQGFSYVFFVQEDQQFIRKIDGAFFSEVENIFRCSPSISQVIPMFFKGYFPSEVLLKRYGIERVTGFYYENQPAYGVSDIGITSIERLANHGYRFSHDESSSGLKALECGLRIAFNRNPALMYTPWPRTTRDHPHTVQALGLGVNPFNNMTDVEIQALLSRPIDVYPIAEQYLRTITPSRQPWWYTAITQESIKQYNSYLRQKSEIGEL